jgi:pimeloyl-ACP methyl ester carboxylesterase
MEHKTMVLSAKPGRRTFVKLSLASAGVPLITPALFPLAKGQTKPKDGGAHGATIVPVSPDLQMFYREDWLGSPWLESAEPVVFLHGNLETGEVWYGWVPRMAQQFRLFRPDLPGYGGSPVPAKFEWSLANFAKVVANFLDAIGLQSAHIVGAKTGGAIAMQFAATFPQRARTLVVASGPFGRVDPQFENSSQQERLGSAATKEQIAYFDKLRSETSPNTRRDIQPLLSTINLDDILQRITARTLIITSDRSALQSVETVVRYQSKIPNSRLLVLTSDAYHVAVANADECVTNVLAFIKETKTPA